MLKVVIIDRDEKSFKELNELISKENYEIGSAKTGKEGQLLVFKNKPDAILLNLGVENHSGIEVLAFLKKFHPNIRRIRLLDKENPPEWDKLNEHFQAKIERPLDYKLLKVALNPKQDIMMAQTNGSQTVHDETAEEASDSLFSRVPIGELLFGSNVLFDIYVRLGERKYLKILHAGDPFSKERFQKYVEKKVEFLYFKAFDRAKFLKYQSLILDKLVKIEKIPLGVKLQQLRNLSEKALEETASFGVNPELLDYSLSVSDMIFKLTAENDEMFSLVNKMYLAEPTLYSHSHNVSLLSVMLAKALKWTSQTTVSIFSMAGLYHDIGKVKFPEEMRLKRPENMSKEELEVYKTHPQLAFDEMILVKKIHPVIPQIILQHHENLAGTGFPRGMHASEINPGARILAVANDFSNMISYNEEFKGKPKEAAQFMLMNQNRNYTQEIIVALFKIFVS